MIDQDKPKFAQAFHACCLSYQKEEDLDTMRLYWEMLKEYAVDDVVAAFYSHIKTSRFFPTPAELCGRIGIVNPALRRPGAEEAWAMIPKSEDDSAILTAEMLAAWGAASKVYGYEGAIPGRMTFIEVYKRKCEEAEAQGIPIRWNVSQGWDKDKLMDVVAEGFRLGRLDPESDKDFYLQLQSHAGPSVGLAGLLGNPKAGISDAERKKVLDNLSGVKEALKPKEQHFDMEAIQRELEDFGLRMAERGYDGLH